MSSPKGKSKPEQWQSNSSSGSDGLVEATSEKVGRVAPPERSQSWESSASIVPVNPNEPRRDYRIPSETSNHSEVSKMLARASSKQLSINTDFKSITDCKDQAW